MREMTSEEIREMAKELIRSVCKQIKFSDFTTDTFGSEKGFINQTELENGETELKFHFSDPKFGKLSVCYSPQSAVEHIIRGFDEAFSGEFYKAILSNEEVRALWEQKVVNIVALLIYNAAFEFQDSFLILPALATLISDFVDEDKMFNRKQIEKKEELQKILRFIENRESRILEMERQQFQKFSAPQYLFCDVYDEFLPVWKKAKAFYNKNKHFPNWLELTAKAFPDFEADQDLIERFAHPDGFDAYAAQPGNIALEYAARILRVPDTIASERTLKRYLAESRRQRKEIPGEKAGAVYEAYLLTTLEMSENQEKQERIFQKVRERLHKNSVPKSKINWH